MGDYIMRVVVDSISAFDGPCGQTRNLTFLTSFKKVTNSGLARVCGDPSMIRSVGNGGARGNCAEQSRRHFVEVKSVFFFSGFR